MSQQYIRPSDPGSPTSHGAQNRLGELQSSFKREVRYGHALLLHLEKGGAKNTSITPPKSPGGLWLLRALLPQDLRERFALAPEVLLLAVPTGGVQARDLDLVRQAIFEGGLRLDADVFIVVDVEPRLPDRLRLLHRSGQWIPWRPISAGSTYQFPDLAEQLRKNLPEYDIFERRDPIRGHHVIGRKDSIAELSTRLESGQSIGVFGLRKVGKTTLVRAATDVLDPLSAMLSMNSRDPRFEPSVWNGSPRVLAVWLDCQKVYERTLEGFSQRLLKELRKRLKLGDVPLPTSALSEEPLRQIEELLDCAAAPDQPPVCIVLDEYDLLFEGEGEQPAIPGLEQVFLLLRAHAQETGKLSVVVIGRDPVFFQSPRMNGVPNPMLSWFITRWVGPLDRAGSNDLLRTLGRRVGLSMGSETSDLAWRLTAGHPLLLRQYGSALLGAARKTSPGRDPVATDPLCQSAVEPFLEREAVMDIFREVYDLLGTRYEAAAVLLEDIAREAEDRAEKLVQESGGWTGLAAKTLRNFGLLSGGPDRPVIPLALRWYTKTYRAPRRASASVA